MAVEQMKLLSITGKDSDLEVFLARNLLNCNIQIEDAKKIYNKGWKLNYYEYDYKVKEAIKKCTNLLNKFEIEHPDNIGTKKFIGYSIDELNQELEQINEKYENSLKNIDISTKRINEINDFIEPIRKLKNIDVEPKKIFECRYLKFRYGNIPNENIEEVRKNAEDLDVILFELDHDADVTWVSYFTTEEFAPDVDGFFNMQKFERIRVPDGIEGMPSEFVQKYNLEITENQSIIKKENDSILSLKNETKNILLTIYNELQTYERINNLKKYIVKDQNNTFYIVVWVPKSDMNDIINMLNGLKGIEFVVRDAKSNMMPPTKLKNFGLFSPFEMIVKMYGVPNIEELDPTTFIAIVTCLMFGFMFGDVGHGAVIFIAGLIMLAKKNKAGAILVDGGIFSIIFGILYGSIFGKENVIKPILISPMENITTMLISGIAVGSILIVLAMILNIVNGIRTKNYKKAILDGNGLAGFIMYGLIIVSVAYYFVKGYYLISLSTVVLISIIILLLILFNENIINFITRKKEKTESGFIEKIFELLEMILSFLSNTVSFLRLAAFAINHAGLCMAIYLLADMTTGVANISISIIGNIIVIVLEGLIVGIQVLRLEYYELFSRFYEGNGREYKSIEAQSKN